jgi:N-dimethylarginine dimethylaminohydrolase
MGIHSAVGTLRRVYVRPPDPASAVGWREFGWHDRPDPVRALDEHAALQAMLEAAGAEVVLARRPVPGDPDAIYVYDPVLPTDRGTIALRPGKALRRVEPEPVVDDLGDAGLPYLGSVLEPGVAEGGDIVWLDERTLLVGLGYRTNEAAADQLRALLPGVDVLSFDLPHHEGPGRCLHLLSTFSPLDRDLVVAFLPMLPTRLVQLLSERAIGIVEVPEKELATMGPNVLALAPRVALALEGSPVTRRRLEAAGVDVRTYVGEEISLKGDGGPTCLTRPLDRDPVEAPA